jgi:hypothetical protein
MGLAPKDLGPLREEARVLRSAMLRGLYEGGLSKWRYPRTQMRAHGRVRVLLVLDEEGTQDASALDLAGALQRRGHHVSALVIADADEQGRFQMRREERDGLTLLHAWRPDRPGVLEAAFLTLVSCELPEIVHFVNLRASSAELPILARDLGLATVATIDDDRAVREDDRALMSAVAAVDLRLCPSVEARAAWIEAASLDPQTLAYFRRAGALDSRGSGGPGQSGKSIQEEARELEFRYRALCTILRTGEARLTHFSAVGASGRAQGKTDKQGSAWLLLRPKSAVEYAITGLPAGPMTLNIEQFQVAAETKVVLAGRALIDGVEVGRLAPSQASAHDRFMRRSLELHLPQGARVLRLEPQLPNGKAAYLRVCRVTLSPPRDRHTSRASRPALPAADLARLAEELRVSPGAAVERSALPRVTIVVPNFNGGAVLGECLQSLSSLDYAAERLELVLVDNGSSDGSVGLARRSLPALRVIAHERNLGFAAACNAGTRVATQAEILVFVNNDMRFERDFLRELVAPLARRECAATTARIPGWPEIFCASALRLNIW